MHNDFHAGLDGNIAAICLDHGDALIERKKRCLVAIDRHADNHPVHQRTGAAEYVQMAEGQGIKGAGIKTSAHCPASSISVSARLRLRGRIASD